MFPNNSPLNTLTAFSIVFVISALSVLGLIKYIEKVRRDAFSVNSAE